MRPAAACTSASWHLPAVGGPVRCGFSRYLESSFCMERINPQLTEPLACGNSVACSFLQRHHGFLPHTSVCRGACKLTPKIFCSTNTSLEDFHQLWIWTGWLQYSAWYILMLHITFLICFGNILFHSAFYISEILRLLMPTCFLKMPTCSGCISD